MSHLPLDARAILHYLNELGYRNISAEQLKEFLKDLRKLIKYEDRLGVNINQPNFREALFERSIANQRALAAKANTKRGAENVAKTSERKTKPQPLRAHNIAETSDERATTSSSNTATTRSPPRQRAMPAFPSAMDKAQSARLEELEQRMKAMQIGLQKVKAPKDDKENKSIQTVAMAKGMNPSVRTVSTQSKVVASKAAYAKSALIPRSAKRLKRRKPRENDPVALYQYYQSEWAHFRRQIPGDDPHTLLRWRVRNKLLNPEP